MAQHVGGGGWGVATSHAGRGACSASLRCKGLAVTAATRQPVPHENGHLRTFYLIELTTETGKKSFMKRYHEVCNLHAQMLSFFPDLQFSVDLRAPALNTNKRQIDVIGARKVGHLKTRVGMAWQPCTHAPSFLPPAPGRHPGVPTLFAWRAERRVSDAGLACTRREAQGRSSDRTSVPRQSRLPSVRPSVRP